MGFLGRFINRLVDAFATIAGIVLIAMMLHITLEVILRYFFKMSMGSTIEIVSNYYMVLVGFLSLCFTEQKKRNIEVELVTQHLPVVVQRHLQAVVLVISAFVFSFMMIRTWTEAVSKYGLSATVIAGNINLPVWPAYFILPLGCFLILLVILYRMLCYLTGNPSSLDERIDDGAL